MRDDLDGTNQTASTGSTAPTATTSRAGRAVVEKATDGLNTEVFQEPGLSAAQLADLTALLGVLRADAGDIVD